MSIIFAPNTNFGKTKIMNIPKENNKWVKELDFRKKNWTCPIFTKWYEMIKNDVENEDIIDYTGRWGDNIRKMIPKKILFYEFDEMFGHNFEFYDGKELYKFNIRLTSDVMRLHQMLCRYKHPFICRQKMTYAKDYNLFVDIKLTEPLKNFKTKYALYSKNKDYFEKIIRNVYSSMLNIYKCNSEYMMIKYKPGSKDLLIFFNDITTDYAQHKTFLSFLSDSGKLIINSQKKRPYWIYTSNNVGVVKIMSLRTKCTLSEFEEQKLEMSERLQLYDIFTSECFSSELFQSYSQFH